MGESEANVGINRCQRGSLALRSFSAAEPNWLGLAGQSVQVSYARHMSQQNAEGFGGITIPSDLMLA